LSSNFRKKGIRDWFRGGRGDREGIRVRWATEPIYKGRCALDVRKKVCMGKKKRLR